MTAPHESIHTAIAIVGSNKALAEILGVTPSAVTHWGLPDEDEHHRPVPVRHCVAIERATSGTVTRRDLRPDDWHLIWPELAESIADRSSAAIETEAQGV